ncbi:MAG TPA: LytTR family DNA-binding domain-containing protein [Bacteroidales bacterium]|jgi:DNA-binding LytR/AlgR family response regulator|nr:LytTR family DNA-binding domain-containing protein [Bacteroidales bacterium]
MTSLRCIIVDDEPLALNLLQDYIHQTPFLELVARCSSGVEALNVFKNENVDLAFIDIQMPHLNGLELSRMMGDCLVIFTTAFEQYALEGFKVNAIDYLLKPFSYAEFLTAANKAQRQATLINASGSLGNSTLIPKNLVVKSDYKQQIINTSEIVYIEGIGDYIKIHLDTGVSVQTLMTLKTIEEELPENQFIRVHRSFIVNIQKVKTIERQRIIFDHVRIPVSDSYKDTFFRALGIK